MILDTDMDFDVDDVGALCLVHSLQVAIYFTLHFRSKLDDYSLQDLGEVELLAVVHSTGYPTAIGAVSVINHYFGR